jgi:hypothetical protein
MKSLDTQQLDDLKNQIEEDYRQDLAAIERLQRRFMAQVTGSPAAPAPYVNSAPVIPPATPSYASPAPAADKQESVWPIPSHGQNQPDELAGSLRAMFSRA